MSWTLCASGAAITKAGLNRNTDVSMSGAVMDAWSDQAEGVIVARTRKDWVDDYANVDAHVKFILDDVCSSIIAKQIIAYDMSGYTSRAEAQTMLDVQDDVVRSGLKELEDFKSNEIKDI